MSTPVTLYALTRTVSGELAHKEVCGKQVVAEDYSIAALLQVAGTSYAAFYTKETGTALLYKINRACPCLERAGELELAKKLDTIESFVMGNQPHLLCYEAAGGYFYFHPITKSLGAGAAYKFRRTHEPGPTSGFTTVKPFVAGPGRAVVFLGYNAATGAVAMYTLSVAADSAGGLPPLFALTVWSHQWSRGWTRFAFFTLGSSNFFLKTNIVRENVNIDHVVDGIAGGTVEVVTTMQGMLPDNQILKLVQPMYFGHGNPYFVTYKDDGTISFFRFWGNCQGWDRVGSIVGPAGANFLLVVRDGENNLLLLC